MVLPVKKEIYLFTKKGNIMKTKKVLLPHVTSCKAYKNCIGIYLNDMFIIFAEQDGYKIGDRVEISKPGAYLEFTKLKG